MPSGSGREAYAVAALGIVAALSLLYTVLLAQPISTWILTWSSVGITLMSLYLAWRFVRAIERIAGALESAEGARTGPEAADE